VKRLCAVLFQGWMGVAVAIAAWSLFQQFSLPWLGVLLTSAAPLVNRIWPYDANVSVNSKVRLPLVSLMVMLGVAWVLLTISDRSWPLWLALGSLGSFLLHTYWAINDDVSH